MTALPVAIKVTMAVVLGASMWRAFFGPPPDQKDLVVARLWGGTSAILYVAGIYALADERDFAPLLLAAGVVALCMAFWHSRGDDGGGGGGGEDDDDNGPIDWDRFDRARREWDKPHVPA